MSIRCFTSTYTGLQRAIVTDIEIGAAFDPSKEKPGPLFPFKAIWDTGATGSVITAKVVAALNLVATSMTQVRHAHGVANANQFVVSIRLPNKMGFTPVRVTEGVLGDGPQVLIGMDIIGRGDFAVTNFNGRTVFTFRTPSCEVIDFTKTQVPHPKSPIQTVVNSQPKIGRNDPCPCGSGKKHKHCCGKNA